MNPSLFLFISVSASLGRFAVRGEPFHEYDSRRNFGLKPHLYLGLLLISCA